MAITDVTVFGDKRVLFYTYTLSGNAATIATGLKYVTFFSVQNTSDATAVYGTVSGGTITLTGSSAGTGYVMVIGY